MLHSATKFLAGHSDVVMGALVVRDDQLYDVLKGRRDLVGAIPGTLEAWLALRGLRTLHLRVERAQANAAELARRLEAHPAVSEVRYPGFGAVVAIVLDGADRADLLTHSTSLWVNATSLGGVESTFERRRRWKTEAADHPRGAGTDVGGHRGRRRPLGRPRPSPGPPPVVIRRSSRRLRWSSREAATAERVSSLGSSVTRSRHGLAPGLARLDRRAC